MFLKALEPHCRGQRRGGGVKEHSGHRSHRAKSYFQKLESLFVAVKLQVLVLLKAVGPKDG